MKYQIALLFVIMAFLHPLYTYAQHLDVDGNARIKETPKDNGADSLVVILPNGTLGVRDASTLEDSDANPSNELQLLSVNGDTLFISQGNFLVLLGFGKTVPCGSQTSLSDIDGNQYKLVAIDDQCWTAENLRTSKYSDGTSVLRVEDDTEWQSLITGARTYYNNDSATYSDVYGALYNFYAVKDPRNLCPTGWHVATHEDYVDLTDYIGNPAGGELKEAGTVHWNSPNAGATNNTGFTGLPGGQRNLNAIYGGVKTSGIYWTSSFNNIDDAWVLILDYQNLSASHFPNAPFRTGYSVRCIKN